MDLLRCLEDDSSGQLRGMLFRGDLLPILQLCKASLHSRALWTDDLKRDVARLREVLHPLQTTHLRIPGFHTAHNIKVLHRHQNTAGPVTPPRQTESLRRWMTHNELGDLLSPSDAILVLNAWPRTTRDIGAALSDFLTETNACFEYKFIRPTASSPSRPTLRIHFLYRGIAGTLVATPAVQQQQVAQPQRHPLQATNGSQHAYRKPSTDPGSPRHQPPPDTNHTCRAFLQQQKHDGAGPFGSMLARQELLPLLKTCRTIQRSKKPWITTLKDDVAHLHKVLAPLNTKPLRLPGFDGPPAISVLSRPPTEQQQPSVTTPNPDHLLLWMVRKKLAGYTPSEAILIMNAWPATTRRAGAALSDFLTETRATMEYTAGSPRSRLPATTKLVITFIYRDITGTLIAG